MKQKLKAIIPILIGLVIAFSVVTVAWIVQDAQMKGITIRSTTGGVTLNIKGLTDTDYTNEYVLNDDATLMPCTKIEASLQDENGNDVGNNSDYVKQISMFIKPSVKAKLYATVEVDGGLPVRVDCNNLDVTTNTEIQTINVKDTRLDFRIWIDGESYSQPDTANITITLHGEEI